MSYRLITEVPAKQLRGKTVLLRASLNVPVVGEQVADDFRIRRAVPTIAYLRQAGARVIILAHIGRDGTQTLEPVARELKKYIFELRFVRSFQELRDSLPAPVVLYENLRRDPREREGSEAFARKLAALGDVFVQDAFSVCHRAHASIVQLPRLLPSYAGLLLHEEVHMLLRMRTPKQPALCVFGGAKFETKEALVMQALARGDEVLVVGALANDFFRQRGIAIGDSLTSNHRIPQAVLEHQLVHLPESVMVRVASGEVERRDVQAQLCSAGESIVDAFAPASLLKKLRRGYFASVIWNGPFGFYEGGFYEGTKLFAETLMQAKEKSAEIVVGGGDTTAALHKLNLQDAATFLSTGGGAMLAFLLHGTLPGLEALGYQKDETAKQSA